MTFREPDGGPTSLRSKACRACLRDVPVGAFCGRCGAASTLRRGDGPAWLRLRSYAAVPDERVLLPTVTTSLFPRLPRRSRWGLRAGLVIVAILLAAFVLLRWVPPLVGISALGLPLLFVQHLVDTGAVKRLSGVTLVITAALGIATGIGWALATNAIWALTYDDVLATPMTTAEALVNYAAVPAGGVALLVLPVAVVRWWRPGGRTSLNGFVIGALGGLCFSTAGFLTQAASEFSNGLVSGDVPADAFFAPAVIRGLATPMTAVAMGGMVGATLWFRRRPDPTAARYRSWLTSPVAAVTVALLICLGQNAIEYTYLSYVEMVGLYVALTVLALLILRVVLHCTLLGEACDHNHDAGRRVPCPQCEHSVPLLGFCRECGASLNGTSDRAIAPHRAAPARTVLVLSTVLAIVVAGTIALSSFLTPPLADFVCPPDCGRPPIGEPVTVNPRFTSADGDFSVSYPGEGSAYTATFDPDGVSLDLHAGDGGSLHLFGESAAGRTPRQIAEDVIADAYPEAKTDYEIPNALVGYQPGYGILADVYRAGSIGADSQLRVLVMVAVKNGLALIAAAAGRYHEYSPEFGTGHPSGANFFLALDMGKYVNSFSWRGDPVR